MWIHEKLAWIPKIHVDCLTAHDPKYLDWRWRVGGQNSTISTLLTKSKNSSKAPHFEDRRFGGQEIDEINAKISELTLEGRGSEIDDFDAFGEFYDFFKSASLRGPVGRGSRNRRKRRKALEGGGQKSSISTLLTKSTICSPPMNEMKPILDDDC